jgi:isocitrate dehydrogenase
MTPTTTSSMTHKTPITVAYGDGVGPEIMQATLHILEAAGAHITPEVIEIGEKVYLSGNTAGIAQEAWASLRRTKVFLKSPITTPSGGGYKSLNVTVRKTLGLYANIRPCAAYHPYVATLHPAMDVVIVRENEEDLYAGIEHRQTDEVFQCLKLITRPGCEKIVRYAFEYAVAHGRKKVTCMTKDNIMKMTDGLFHKVFDEIGAEYPAIKTEHMIIDIGTARLASRPEQFDVIVTPNLYGDIISDVAAELTGSVGLGGSANIGEHVAMFEAIHGSAPDIAGLGVANPSGLLLGAVMMLVHIGQNDVAQRVHNAWLKTIEDGIQTADLTPGVTGGDTTGNTARDTAGDTKAKPASTAAFAAAVIARLGQTPSKLKTVRYDASASSSTASVHTAQAAKPLYTPRPPAQKTLVGVDVFVHTTGVSADYLAVRLQTLSQQPSATGFKLQMITNRGVKVWPGGFPETFCTDHWRCRFLGSPVGTSADSQSSAASRHTTNHNAIIALLQNLQSDGVDFIKTENLCLFDGEAGFALGQGQ